MRNIAIVLWLPPLIIAALLVFLMTAHAQLPPPEYDRPYTGQLTVTEAGPDELRAVCRKTAFPFAPVACARHRPGDCHIFKLPDPILIGLGKDPDIVMRHELGHCNGWPWFHPGVR